MPAYSNVTDALKSLSKQEAEVTLAHGRDPDTIGFICFDNVQHYLPFRDHCIESGRQLDAGKLIIGMAATYYEIDMDETTRKAFRLDAKAEKLAEGLRKTLTVGLLNSLIDNRHIETVLAIQWIQTLVNTVPELSHLKSEVTLRYRTKGSKQLLPAAPSKIHPLASSGRNETVLTELKDGLFDFLSQVGQTPENFKDQLFPVIGDGLSFDRMYQAAEMLQFEEDSFNSLRFLQPILAFWHTEWTNLSRLTESHWGDSLSTDPALLGNSAEKIGQKRPSNLKKVDFYPHRDLAFEVLDARILDCWRYVH